MKYFVSLLIIFSVLQSQQKPFLSNLNDTKHSPLYTTYAAAMERSEFTLDEGYHFLMYDSTRGADFTTDNAGDWSLAFRKGTKYVYTLKDMTKEPVITMSYPDLVKYYFYPFEKLRTDVTFLTYSSRIAIQDITLTNEQTEKISIDLLPFFQNSNRAFSNVQIQKDKNAVTFTHEEFPDDWVRSHGVPYVDNVDNVILYSNTPERMSSFRSYKWGTVEIPQNIEFKKSPVYTVWGRITHKDKERCNHRSDVTMTVIMNNDRRKMIIENAPRWGSAESNINAYALYGIELGNFGPVKQGDQFTIILKCNATNQETVVSGTVDTSKGNNVRMDAQCADVVLPKSVQGVKRDIWGSGTELRLYWKGDAGTRYNVYRRDYRKGGVYELQEEIADRYFFTDKNVPEDKIYGYVVTAVDANGNMSTHSNEVNNIEGSDFLTDVKYPGQVKGDAKDLSRVISASKRFEIAPGATAHFRIIRGVKRPDEDQSKLLLQLQQLMSQELTPFVQANEKLFSAIPVPQLTDPDQALLYWTSFAMMRQVMLPPEGKSSFNYYVFSREPQWGWGHGGQVFHESLSMLSYALMDNVSAMNSQRVYRERQMEDGYINYRTGGFLDETIPENNQLTTSAPWYAWQNWEVYKISKDKTFLKEMYASSKAFYNYYVKNRDSDGDGLCEWGGEAVLESVRDARVAVWDEVGYPSNYEAVDLNSMLVQEEKSLAAMALELGEKGEGKEWLQRAEDRSKKINETMWDDSTGFYYNVDKKTHTFSFKNNNDLKRQEIIGFLPMWAGIADKKKADRLMEKLTDPKKFWRKYGVPSLSADDPYYNPKGYWNGPVWVEWDYFIMRALIDYGYRAEAKELVSRVASNMSAELKKNHNLWEFYSPDDQWAGYHKTYIWAGMISRMLLDVSNKK